MDKPQTAKSAWRKFLRVAFYTIGSILLLVVLLLYALTLSPVQQRITREAQSYLQEKLGTRVEIGSIGLRFPYDISLKGLLLEDQQQDTLIRVGSLVVTLDMWKLLDRTIVVQEIQLDDATVYLNQKDSTYNYDFIVNAFATPNAPKSTTPSSIAWTFETGSTTIRVRKVHFLMQDEDSASSTEADIGLLETVLQKSDLEKLDFELGKCVLRDADIQMIQKKAAVSSSEASPRFSVSMESGAISHSHFLYSTIGQYLETRLEEADFADLHLNSSENDLDVQAKDIHLANSAIVYRDPEAVSTPKHFNASDLDLRQLNADLLDFSFQHDSLSIEANALSGTDKSGLTIHSLQASIQMTPSSLVLQRVLAHLNQTRVDGDVLLLKKNAVSYGFMEVQMRQLKGLVGDLLLLLPPFENKELAQLQDMPYEVSGRINGWLENLQTEQIKFRAGTGTRAYFNGALQQVGTPTQLGMHLKLDQLESNRTDMLRFMALGGSPMDSLQNQVLPSYVRANGTLDGNMENLQLNLKGDVGTLQRDTTFAPVLNQPLSFELAGTLTSVSDPDKLGMDLTIQQLDAPQSFFVFLAPDGILFPDLLQANGTLKGTLSNLQADVHLNASRGGTSSSLAFQGLLKSLRTPDQLGFDGNFKASLARQEILGYVPDLSQSVRLPTYIQVQGNAMGTVQDAAGKLQIGLGNWGDLDLEGTLKDSSYQLQVVGQNVLISQLAKDSAMLPLKTIGFHAQLTGAGFDVWESAQMQLSGNIDSLIWGNAIFRDITLDAEVSGKRFKGNLVSTDKRAAIKATIAGDFETAIPMLDADISLDCIDLRTFGWDNRPTQLCGHMVSHSEGLSLDTLKATVRIENLDLQYDTVHVQPGDMVLDISLDQRQNRLGINSDWLKGEVKGYFSLTDLPKTVSSIFEQYFVVDRTVYVPRVSNDSVSVQLDFLQPDVLTTGLIPGLTDMAPMHLEGALVGQRNYFNLQINAPRIGYMDWVVDSLNVRSYAGDSSALFVLTTPKLTKGNEDFIENAVLNGAFVANKATASFKATNNEGRERFLLAAEATINNSTLETIVKLSPRQLIDFKEWVVDAENEIKIKPNGIAVQQLNMRGAGQSILLSGSSQALPDGKTGLDFALDIDRLNYNNFDIFLSDVLQDMGGWAEARVSIKGQTDDIQLRGSMKLHETYFTPELTNVRYELSETPLEFTSTGITVDGLTLVDPFGKSLEINGSLTTTNWSDINANLSLHAKQWQVLNTTRQQNPLYFGKLFVSLDGTVQGPISQPDLKLSLKTAKESSFTYVYDEATEYLQHEGVVYFVPPPRQYVRPQLYDAPVITQPYTLSASIEIDSNLTVNSVINPVTGDDFIGKASGKLQLDVLSNGVMTLVGRLELVRGVYNYSYQSVVKRSFNVSTGSAITWTGDIEDPELDIKARYQFKASPFPLVATQLMDASADETAAYRKSQTFFLQTSIAGSVTTPDVGFQFIYPEEESQGSLATNFGNQEASLVANALNTVNQDKNQLSRQVFGVLLLRNFIGNESFAVTSVSGTNPLQSGLTDFLTNQINALADQYLTWIDIDLSTGDAADRNTASDEPATNYQLRLQKSFFGDRLTFKITGGTTVGNSTGQTHSALENASVEYALTPNGAFKITVFSEQGFELLNTSTGNLRNSGVGLIFTKEFGKK
ncbi:MAG: translocation/assembly module TamB domain-containing protein [Lewinellaceae bacterium]|nr:translocation/assembly module TamB domain-containing protein [Lewinellaceae bacterium]